MADPSSAKSVWVSIAFVLLLQCVCDAIKIVQPFPQNIYPIEGESASVTCTAEGTTDKVQFVRRNEFGEFTEIKDIDRVFTTNSTSNTTGVVRTVFVLHFTSIKVGDDSNVQRYECWAHRPGDNTDQWDFGAKHGFNVQVIRKNSLPMVSPNEAVKTTKKVGDFLELVCNMTIPKNPVGVKPEAVHWLKNKVIIETIYADDAGKFKRTLKPLVFASVSPSHGGNYTCIMETKLKSVKPFNITGGPYVVEITPQFSGKKTDNEIVRFNGENARFECSAVGFPLQVEWNVRLRQDKKLEEIEQTNDTKSHHIIMRKDEYSPSILEIEKVQYADRGFYNCCIVRMNSSVKNDCQEFVLRVRDPLGPLWPVIGIIIEVIILFLILFFTERRRKNKNAAERTDGRAEFSYSSTDDGDKAHVRLRSAAEKPKET